MKMGYKRIMAAGMAAVMLCTGTGSATPAYGAEASVDIDETMYVNLDYYGRVNKVNVVKGVGLNGQTEFTDYGAYGNVINMSSDIVPVLGDGSVTWNLPGAQRDRFYYKCELDNGQVTLPWDFDVSYKLNGVPMDGNKLAGVSGLIEINIKADPNDNAREYYRNNLMLMVAVPVDMSKCYSVEADGSQTQNLGETTAVVFTALPGEEGDYTVRIGTDRFESIGVIMAMMPGTVEDLEHIKDLKEAKDTWQDAGDELYDSLEQMAKSVESMRDGVDQVRDGMDSAESARQKWSNSKDSILAGNDQTLASLGSVSQQLETMIPHLQTAKESAEVVHNSMNDIVNTLGDMQDPLRKLQTRLDNIKSSAGGLSENIPELTDLMQELLALDAQLQASEQAYITGIGSAASGISLLDDDYFLEEEEWEEMQKSSHSSGGQAGGNANSGGSTSGTANGITDGTADGTTNGTTDGTTDGTMGGTTDGAASSDQTGPEGQDPGNAAPGNDGKDQSDSSGEQSAGGSGSQGTSGSESQGTSGSGNQETSGSQGTSGSGSQGTSASGSQGTGGSGSQGTSGSGSQGTSGSGNQGTSGSGNQETSGSGNQGTSGSGNQGTSGSGSQGTSGSGSQGTSGGENQGETGNGSQGTNESGSQGVTGSGSKGITVSDSQGTTGNGTQALAGSRTQGTTISVNQETTENGTQTLAVSGLQGTAGGRIQPSGGAVDQGTGHGGISTQNTDGTGTQQIPSRQLPVILASIERHEAPLVSEVQIPGVTVDTPELLELLGNRTTNLREISKSSSELAVLMSNLMDDTSDSAKYSAEIVDNLDYLIEDLTALNDSLDVYYPDLQAALDDSKELVRRTTDALNNGVSTMTIVQNTLKDSSDDFDAAARDSLRGSMELLDKSLNILDSTTAMRQAGRTMKDTIDNELDKFDTDNRFLFMDPSAEKVSFTSDKNKSPKTLQIIMRTDEISVEDDTAKTADAEAEKMKESPLQRMWNVLVQMWRAMVSIFKNR